MRITALYRNYSSHPTPCRRSKNINWSFQKVVGQTFYGGYFFRWYLANPQQIGSTSFQLANRS